MPTTITPTRLASFVSLVAITCASLAASAGAATPSLYVTNAFGFGHPARVTGYAAGASGNVAPITNLAGASQQLRRHADRVRRRCD